MFESIGMAPRRIIVGPMTTLVFEAQIPSKMAYVKEMINLGIMGGGRVH